MREISGGEGSVGVLGERVLFEDDWGTGELVDMDEIALDILLKLRHGRLLGGLAGAALCMPRYKI